MAPAPLSHGWLWGWVRYRAVDDVLLLHRETLRAWRWPNRAVDLAALSDDHVLFRDRDGYRYTLLTRDGEVRAQFPVQFAAPASKPVAFFSPDGQAVVIQEADAIYHMAVTDLRPRVLFKPEPREGWTLADLRAVYSGPAPAKGQLIWDHPDHLRSSPGPVSRLLLVEVRYERPLPPESDEEPEYDREWRLFDWDGVPLSEAVKPVCEPSRPPGPHFSIRLSPDGRYVAWQQESMTLNTQKLHGSPPPPLPDLPPLPIPAVVIADAETCQPLFRVLSAYLTTGRWDGQWLSNSEGLVIGVAGGYAVVRPDSAPTIIDLPLVPPSLSWSPGPVPAPTGDGRYFAYGFTVVYDAYGNRWLRTAHKSLVRPPDAGGVRVDFSFEWGETHEEIYALSEWWGGLVFDWLLLRQPRIEFPPFDDELGFHVARTGSCLNLWHSSGDVLDCLPDGASVSLVREYEPPLEPWGMFDAGLQPDVNYGEDWIYVRTADGREGWVASPWLDHD